MILTEEKHYIVEALTDPGSTGKNNEDRYGTASFRLSETDPTPVLFAMVADGIGGKQAGEIAAEIAVETILSAVMNSDGMDPIGTMREAILESNQLINQRAGETMETSGMGTTVTCAWLFGDQLFAGNVGNSRLYLLRDKKLKRISIDHSWVEEALELGLLTPAQAKNHPNARIITRHLGSEEIEPDFRIKLASEEADSAMVENQGMQLRPNDLLLICSDGLSDMVEDMEIQKALLERPLRKALEFLTDLANKRGGPDNITSVAIRIPKTTSTYSEPTVPSKLATQVIEEEAPEQPRQASRFAVYILSIILLVALVLLGWIFLPLLMP